MNPPDRAHEVSVELDPERTLFADGPVVVFRWRAVSGWPVEHVSTNVVHLFGWTAEEFMGGSVAYADTVHPDDLDRVAHEVQLHADSGDSHFEQDYRVVARDGTTRWLYDQTRIIRDGSGAVTHFLGYVLDISSRRRAEAELREKEEQLAESGRVEALGRLAGGVAHDFNNLLTALTGHLELVSGHLSAEHPARPSLAIARRTVDRGAALTAQLLAVSRRQLLTPKAVDVNRAVQETLDLLAPLLGEQLVVALELEPAPLFARVDPTQLQQVLLNLALNARDAMPAGGTLRFRTRGAADTVSIAVSDTGVGMDEGTAARIFEPFYSTREGGTGLGLATVRGIVEQSQGQLSVDSSPGVGSTFTVVLPSTRPRPTPSLPPPEPEAVRSGRVLVVEDHADIRELIADVLTARGYQVRAAVDGDDALRILEGFVPDLLVTDASMPGKGGAELVRILDDRGWTVPVLFVSGHVRDLQLPTGPRRVLLRKPFSLDQLLRHVSALLA